MSLPLRAILGLLLAILLFAAPANAALCAMPAPAGPDADMPCCDHSCACPADNTCAAASTAPDRLPGQAVPEIAVPAPVMLYAVAPAAGKSLLAPAAVLSRVETRPPPMPGSPPQARLRVWLL